MKRFILALCMVLCIGSVCFAASEDVSVVLNKQVMVVFDGVIQEFQNVNGVKVYPITYNGTTYLPIRAVSSLFGTEIRWDGETKSVYLGEGELDTNSARSADEFTVEDNEEIVVLRNEDVTIYFNGDSQTFADVNGSTVYPLTYEGTTYLPVRAVSNLFGLNIEWDGENNAVLIERNGENTGDDIAYGEEDPNDTEVVEIYSYTDEEDGKEVYFYFDDDTVNYYYFDENDNLVTFYYDFEGNIVYTTEDQQ